MPAKDAAARFPFDDTTTHMCVYNVRTRGKEERNRERERRGRRTKAGFMKRRVCRRRARFTWNEIRGVVHILLFDAVKNRKREREDGRRLVRDCSTRSRLHIWCWPPFGRDKTPNTITPLCRQDAKVMGSFPTGGGGSKETRTYLVWSIKKGKCRWFESKENEEIWAWNFFEDCDKNLERKRDSISKFC